MNSLVFNISVEKIPKASYMSIYWNTFMQFDHSAA